MRFSPSVVLGGSNVVLWTAGELTVTKCCHRSGFIASDYAYLAGKDCSLKITSVCYVIHIWVQANLVEHFGEETLTPWSSMVLMMYYASISSKETLYWRGLDVYGRRRGVQ
ncbi:hypothetical protein IW262DRAFT_1059462 [Armillaria fumosa]|nr:hypothetical protein IW262DRAFT_1059462 [Armillaria fumosa]